ncbi:MAG: sigma-70 family RNA polymerase sigma factor [Pricia sp.]|nr:sigma-70 family RNA polymerase sigma factor [Pricia sp.]
MKESGEERIKTMFKMHYREWCLWSYSYLEDMAEAEDVVQDIFVKILDMQKLDDILDLKKYISTAVRNASLKKIKQSEKLRGLYQDINIALPSFEEMMIEMETSTKVRTAIEELPEKSKKVLDLCVIEGLSYENAASSMEISVNTLKYHLKRAFKEMRYKLRNV